MLVSYMYNVHYCFLQYALLARYQNVQIATSVTVFNLINNMQTCFSANALHFTCLKQSVQLFTLMSSSIKACVCSNGSSNWIAIYGIAVVWSLFHDLLPCWDIHWLRLVTRTSHLEVQLVPSSHLYSTGISNVYMVITAPRSKLDISTLIQAQTWPQYSRFSFNVYQC